jgi:hypothetical protein
VGIEKQINDQRFGGGGIGGNVGIAGWFVAAEFKTVQCCLEPLSRKPSWPAFMCERIDRCHGG